MTTACRTSWPGPPAGREDEPAPDTADGDGDWPQRLAEAVTAADAPDAVFAVSRHGRRTVVTGGTGPSPGRPRDRLRYEIGSATKAYTGLLLAHLVDSGLLTGGEPAAALLGARRPPGRAPVT
ncbi:serine hydrolase, partial [Streptomyces sp. McG8]|nr:beta-lactamase family protein [Streptomyces sp. McG8]